MDRGAEPGVAASPVGPALGRGGLDFITVGPVIGPADRRLGLPELGGDLHERNQPLVP